MITVIEGRPANLDLGQRPPAGADAPGFRVPARSGLRGSDQPREAGTLITGHSNSCTIPPSVAPPGPGSARAAWTSAFESRSPLPFVSCAATVAAYELLKISGRTCQRPPRKPGWPGPAETTFGCKLPKS